MIRVGRTKAYAMAREWRATGGKSGLPVIDFGHVLRVPRCQLEALLGGPLTSTGTAAAGPAEGPTEAGDRDATTEEHAPVSASDTVRTADTTDSTARRLRRSPRLSQSNQQSLFDSLPD